MEDGAAVGHVAVERCRGAPVARQVVARLDGEAGVDRHLGDLTCGLQRGGGAGPSPGGLLLPVQPGESQRGRVRGAAAVADRSDHSADRCGRGKGVAGVEAEGDIGAGSGAWTCALRRRRLQRGEREIAAEDHRGVCGCRSGEP